MFGFYKKEKIILIITFVLLASLWAVLCLPRIKLINKLSKQLADLEVLTEANLKAVKDAADFERVIDRMKQESMYLAKQLESKADVSLFLNELSEISEKNALRVLKIEALNPKKEELSVSVLSAQDMEAYPVYLEVQGRFLALAEFFKELRDSSLITSVDSLRIQSEGNIGPEVKALMTITAYVIKSGEK